MLELYFILLIYGLGAFAYLLLILATGGYDALRHARGRLYAVGTSLGAALTWPWWALEFLRKP